MTIPEKLYTPEEVAKYLRISIITMRKYLRDGVIKGIKIHNQWRITSEELERFLRDSNP
jgi:excisionase family DNA binding protein